MHVIPRADHADGWEEMGREGKREMCCCRFLSDSPRRTNVAPSLCRGTFFVSHSCSSFFFSEGRIHDMSFLFSSR